MAGCEFNRQLEIDKYIENKATHGERYARQYLKTNMEHYRAKENGREVPTWSVRVSEKGLTAPDGMSLLELTEQPLVSRLADRVSSEIKGRVSIELETVRYANELALRGTDTIILPEHVSENGKLSVGFITVYQKDPHDASIYHGSQIALGENLTVSSAKLLMEKALGGLNSRLIQSSTHDGAFVFGLEKTDVRDHQTFFQQITNSRTQSDGALTEFKSTIWTENQKRKLKTLPLGQTAVGVARRDYFIELKRKVPKILSKMEKSIVDNVMMKPFSSTKSLVERFKNRKRKRPYLGERTGTQIVKPQERVGKDKKFKSHAGYERLRRKRVELMSKVTFKKEPPDGQEKRKSKVKYLKAERRRLLVFQLKHSSGLSREQTEASPRRLVRKPADTRSYNEKDKTINQKSLPRIGETKKRAAAEQDISVKNKFKEQVSVHSLEEYLRKWLGILEKTGRKRLKSDKLKKLGENGGRERASILVKKEKRASRKEIVAKIAVAWLLWQLLAAEKPVKRLVVEEKAVLEAIAKPEQHRWLMLSIIWYLAALREQGQRGQPINKYASKQIKKPPTSDSRLLLPQSGIIFAAYS